MRPDHRRALRLVRRLRCTAEPHATFPSVAWHDTTWRSSPGECFTFRQRAEATECLERSPAHAEKQKENATETETLDTCAREDRHSNTGVRDWWIHSLTEGSGAIMRFRSGASGSAVPCFGAKRRRAEAIGCPPSLNRSLRHSLCGC